jgi:hypothetical protein
MTKTTTVLFAAAAALLLQLYVAPVRAQATPQDITNLGGVISAQYQTGSPTGEAYPNLIDNNINTKYLTNNASGWVQYQANATYVVTSYTITSANDAPERDPLAWVLQGSDNGNNWTTIDTRSNEDFPNRLQTRTFTFSNSTPYVYYRFNFVNNSGILLQLAEIELWGTQVTGSWTANWIWTADQGPNNTWLSFRKKVTLSAQPSKAITRIAAENKYWLYVNDSLVVKDGGMDVRPDITNTYYDEVDLAPYLKSGDNTIAALVWYKGGSNGYTQRMVANGGFLFEAAVTGATPASIVSDNTWKVIANPAFTRGTFNYKYGVSGTITFNNATFTDPVPNVPKAGYRQRQRLYKMRQRKRIIYVTRCVRCSLWRREQPVKKCRRLQMGGMARELRRRPGIARLAICRLQRRKLGICLYQRGAARFALGQPGAQNHSLL